ncbi:DNA/RNA nuclease SfsA [Thermodesulfobacteriota bacterium]
MKLPGPLTAGTLVKRYKRFLADVVLNDGSLVTAHCPNSGTMKTCSAPGSPVLLSPALDPGRRTRWTWELIFSDGVWIGTNTLLPNRLVEKALRQGGLPEFGGWEFVRREVPLGQRSRIDFLLQRQERLCYVEVKNVTMVVDGVACFPDAVTARGAKHLRKLQDAAAEGHRACMLYLIQRGDGRRFRPAEEIDPDYSRLLRVAAGSGVEVIAYRAEVSTAEVALAERVPADL